MDTPSGEKGKRPSRKRWLRLLAKVAVLYALVCLAAMIFEERLIFFPERYPAGLWSLPERLGLVVEDVWLDTEDGERIHGWYAPSNGLGPHPVALFFHGNAGNLSYRTEFVRALCGMGLDVLIIDYRGYGRSTGKPSEQGLYRDAEAAWSYLVSARSVEPGRIILFGRSLGGGVAAEMASRHPEAAGVILESTFRSVAHIGQRQFPFLPIRWLLRTRFDNLAKAATLRMPALIVHGEADELIPFEEGKAIFEALPGPRKTFHPVPGGTHNDTWYVGGLTYLQAVARFASDVTATE